MVKTNFDKSMKEIHNFEKKIGFEKTSKKQLVKWLKDEIKNYEKARNKITKRNKLMDAIVLIKQLARRENISLDKAWKRWWKKSRKYLCSKNKNFLAHQKSEDFR